MESINEFWREITKLQQEAGYGNGVSYNPDKKKHEIIGGKVIGFHDKNIKFVMLIDNCMNYLKSEKLMPYTAWDYQGKPNNPNKILKYEAHYGGNLFLFEHSELFFENGVAFYDTREKGAWHTTGGSEETTITYCFKAGMQIKDGFTREKYMEILCKNHWYRKQFKQQYFLDGVPYVGATKLPQQEIDDTFNKWLDLPTS